MGNNLGRRTLVMDLFRDFLADLYRVRYTAPGTNTTTRTSAAARAFVQKTSTAAFLRSLGDAARDLPLEDAENYILTAFTTFLQRHDLYRIYHPRRKEQIRNDLRALLKQPDADVVFARLNADTAELLAGILEQAEVEGTPEDSNEKASSEVTILFERMRSVLKKYRSRHMETEWCIDSVVDRIIAETVWTLCVLGANRQILREIPFLAADLHDLLDTPFHKPKGGS